MQITYLRTDFNKKFVIFFNLTLLHKYVYSGRFREL